MRNRPMTVTVRRPSYGVVDISIEHDVAASYSRAVDPRATREARRVLRGTWRLTDVEYGLDTDVDGNDIRPNGRCRSRFTYISEETR